MPDETGWLIAVFVCLAANTDRNDGAITRLPDVVHVDHGLYFGVGPTTSPFFQARQVHVEHGELRIEAAISDQLAETLQRVVPDIDPREDPEAFARALPERMDYTYMIASEPHTDDSCPFDQIRDEPGREPGRDPRPVGAYLVTATLLRRLPEAKAT